MSLFIKSFLIGIGKIIPGVSGALLAINFGIYEKLLESVINFFDDWKEHLRYILVFIVGLLSAIILCSNIILFLLNNYKFITMMFFIGLILGGTYNFSRKIRYSYRNTILIILIVFLLLFLSLNTINNTYVVRNNFADNVVFFIGGIVEILASIVPGISSTSLLMMIGIYDELLRMVASIFNYSYVIDKINIYISYGLGMFISLIINLYLVNYLINKYKDISYTIILGLSIASIVFLLIVTFKSNLTIMEFVSGSILLILGIIISSIFDK